MEETGGYKGSALRFLTGAKASVGDVLQVTTDWGTVTGTVVPRYTYNDEEHLVLKLSSGYNVGLRVERLKSGVVVKKGEKPSFASQPSPRSESKLPAVLIIGTGGTIASRVDYRTGAVHSAVTAADLYALIPELSKKARIEPEILLSIYSENMKPEYWALIARRVEKAVAAGAAGVVITHGTDTLGYTAAALSFALDGVPIPVILTAAQRSSDRPSSDGVLNLMAAVDAAASAPFSGVYVAMHLDSSDDVVAFHRGTRVRKDHTSARGSFQSMGVPLAAVWGKSGPEHIEGSLPPRAANRPFAARADFDASVALIKFYPSMPTIILGALRKGGTKAVVIEGSGLGHVNTENINELKKFVSNGGLAFMTSQCLAGRVDLDVYDTGRDLLAAGVVPLEDMLPETALVKAMWVLANSGSAEEAKTMMSKGLAGETTSRRFGE